MPTAPVKSSRQNVVQFIQSLFTGERDSAEATYPDPDPDLTGPALKPTYIEWGADASKVMVVVMNFMQNTFPCPWWERMNRERECVCGMRARIVIRFTGGEERAKGGKLRRNHNNLSQPTNYPFRVVTMPGFGITTTTILTLHFLSFAYFAYIPAYHIQ